MVLSALNLNFFLRVSLWFSGQTEPLIEFFITKSLPNRSFNENFIPGKPFANFYMLGRVQNLENPNINDAMFS